MRKLFYAQLQGYRMTTAEILYHMPDHPGLLQSYVWQDLDLAPEYPVLNRFLKFWNDNLDGPVHSVRVASSGIVSDAELRLADGEFTLH
ncbi:MAG: usg protein [Alphaproteobacteria bacterium]